MDRYTSVHDIDLEIEGPEAHDENMALHQPPLPAAPPAASVSQTILPMLLLPPSQPGTTKRRSSQLDWSGDLASPGLSGSSTPAAIGASNTSASHSPARKVRRGAETFTDGAAEARERAGNQP